MKKIIIAFAALAAALSLVSCNKEQIETPSTGLKLNITVGNLDGTGDTKAIKNDWAEGDKLNIWFDQIDYTNPDLVVKYDGTEWSKDEEATVSGKEPEASGNLIVLYEGYNDWSQYSHNSAYLNPVINKFAGAVNGYAYAQPMAYANDSAIAYTFESNTLTADLNSWKSLTKIQVVVTGLDSADAANYALKEQNMARGIAYYSTTSITTSNITMGGATIGVPNEEGVAFYFTGTGNPSSRTFTLLDLTTMQEKTYSVTGKTIETGTRKVVGIKIAADKFQVPVKTPDAIDLGLSVKWASYNLGADAPAQIGGYYQWAGTEDVSGTSNNLSWSNCPYHSGLDYRSGWTKYVSSSKSSYAQYGIADNKKVLDLSDDAAHLTYGGKWRMPTSTEWEELIDNCNWTWTKMSGVDGYKVVSKKNGNSIFLPAAGNRIANLLDNEINLYWSSSPIESDPAFAFCLDFGQDYVYYNYGSRCAGLPIRAICEK